MSHFVPLPREPAALSAIGLEVRPARRRRPRETPADRARRAQDAFDRRRLADLARLADWGGGRE